MTTPHLTAEQLDHLRQRKLPADELIAVTDHLAACDVCQQRALVAGAPAVERFLASIGEHVEEPALVAYIDGRLDALERAAVDRHLERCGSCRREAADLRTFAAADAGRQHVTWRYFAVPFAAAAVVLLVVLGWLARDDRAGLDVPGVATVEPADNSDPLDGLTPEQRQIVSRALSTGAIEFPPFLKDLGGVSGTLMGRSDGGPGGVFEPAGTAVLDDRPGFAWEPIASATHYIVTIQHDATGKLQSSPPLTSTGWQPEEPLATGQTYTWQVAARVNGREIVMPSPPAPPARFAIVDEATADAMRRLPSSALARGILYARAGLLADSERELLVAAADPAASQAQTLLRQVQERRSSSRGR